MEKVVINHNIWYNNLCEDTICDFNKNNISAKGYVMKFKSITIENYRNFESISVELSNRNVFFGLNDVGKSNFIHALKLLFEKETRKKNCVETDYFCHNTSTPIVIMVAIDISDEDNNTEKLRAKMSGVALSDENILYIKLEAHYNETEMLGIPILYWGGDVKNLFEMNQKGYMYDIDYVFNVIYIDSYVDMFKLFSYNAKKLIRCDDEDKCTLQSIDGTISQLNDFIASLSGVRKFEDEITHRIQKYRDKNLSVEIKSEIAVKELFNNVIPYIKKEKDNRLYPTAGDGRKKLLAYSIFDILSEEFNENKINLFFIEEPENHMHKSMQISLSKIFFNNNGHEFLFITTHSPYILYEMDNVSLIRIYNDIHHFHPIGASYFYNISEDLAPLKYILNAKLAEAVFANKVLLVEGPSEALLFGKILSFLNPDYEADGGYILTVNGVAFESYYKFLKKLDIHVIVKTDNDLRQVPNSDEFNCLGFLRCNKLLCENILPTENIDENSIKSKRKIYENNISELVAIRKQYSIYLSRCDLEHDLDEVMHDKLISYLKNDDPVKYLQQSKEYHMAELIQKLSDEDCKTIAAHDNFQCLQELK